MNHTIAWHADGDRLLVLQNAPAEHGEILLAGGFTADKRKLAGKQHIDMGIAEEQAVAMISGMAKGGLHPVWTVYSTFIQRTYDQIAQDLCINSNPAVINVVGGGVNSMMMIEIMTGIKTNIR